jgi:hypothetical protein
VPGGSADGHADGHRLTPRPVHRNVSALRELRGEHLLRNGDVHSAERRPARHAPGGSADNPACTATGICAVSFTGTINGGTGRFEGAAGTLTGTGTVDLIASTVTAALTGTINKDPQPF